MFQDAVHSLIVQPDDGIAPKVTMSWDIAGGALEQLNPSMDCAL